MRRLNDNIREDVTSYHNLKIIKTSVFFLCHWSKKFQNRIATKLHRCIYSPQESLTQIHGKEKIFLLERGKMEVRACKIKNPSN